MSFAIPYLFRNSVKKKRENVGHQQAQTASLGTSCGIGGGNIATTHEPSYPTLVSMIQAKAAASPSPSPSSSTSSRSRPTSIAHLPAVALEAEELEDNRFYRYIRSHFNLIFSRSMVVCVPHSRSLDGLILTKDFIGRSSFFLFYPLLHKKFGVASARGLFKEKQGTLVLTATMTTPARMQLTARFIT